MAEAVEETAHYCYHCGAVNTAENLDADWLCPQCDKYQDSVTCPTCHQVANKSLMDAGDVPPPAKPKKA